MAINWLKRKKPEAPVASPRESDNPPVDVEESTGWVSRLRSGLSKTRRILTTDLDELFSGQRKLDDGLLEELEERLVTADIGVSVAMELIDALSSRSDEIETPDQLRDSIREEILKRLQKPPLPVGDASGPRVVLVVGVNGVGKTTTIGKLASRAREDGQKVLLAAGDTFRAAAGEQLEIWARRAGAEIVRHREGSDPAAVAYDGVSAAQARGVDLVLVDTAGRLHTKTNLMEEIKKMKRAIAKRLPEAPHEVLLVLDATTGQNALSQARMFDEALGVTGIALTKLDGTARGGIAVGISASLGLPLQYIGVGEGLEDLQAFDPQQFVRALI
jgi:fused signal recognition particle receptor